MKKLKKKNNIVATEKNPLGKTKTKIKLGPGGNIKNVKQTSDLSNRQKRLLKSEEKLNLAAAGATRDQLGRVTDTMSKPLDFSGLPEVSTFDRSALPEISTFDTESLPTISSFDTSGFSPEAEADDATRQRVEDALYGRATSRLDPQFDKRRRDLETQLVNSGFARGSEGFNKALDDFGRTENDAYATARNDAIAAGGSEQSRLFDMASSARSQDLEELLSRIGAEGDIRGQLFGEQGARIAADQATRGQLFGEQGAKISAEQAARNQMLSEIMTERNQPFGELASVAGLATGATLPQFSGGPASTASGGQQQQFIANQNAQQQEASKKNSLWDSIFQLGGNVAGAWLS